ncbi:MAG: alpha/beta hydrolase-fold protein [Actinomycetaceae bacterium]|nr:alpha/beta hydrolase-fold protein [Actinomycetaceae bacterium]
MDALLRPETTVSDRIAELGPDPDPRAIDELWHSTRAAGCLVEDSSLSGLCRVTFLWREPRREARVAVYIDTITDFHRSSLDGFELFRLGRSDLLHRTFLLPEALRATVSYWAPEHYDPAIGTSRDGWARMLAECQAPADASGRVANSRGGWGSIIALPGAPPSRMPAGDGDEAVRALRDPSAPSAGGQRGPAERKRAGRWHASGEQPARTTERQSAGPAGKQRAGERRLAGRWGSVELAGRGLCATAWVPDDPPRNAVVLLDGAMWRKNVPVQAGIEAVAPQPTLVVYIDPPEGVDRADLLGLNPALPELVADVLDAAGAGHVPPERAVVAGQSLGGLASAWIAYSRPDRFGNAIVQSASLWWPEDDPYRLTRLYSKRTPADLPVRFFHEVGCLEWHLAEENRQFAAVLAEAGFDIAWRQYMGGHDYACWREGILDGLAHLL